MPKGKGDHKFYTILGGYPKFWEVFYLVWPLIFHYFDVKGGHRFYTIFEGYPLLMLTIDVKCDQD